MIFKKMAIAGAVAMAAVTTVPNVAMANEITGNIGVLSSYNLRGITNAPENESVTLQGGLDYAHESGFYAGWWTSTLGDAYPDNGLEHDFYVGYSASLNDDLAYTAGLTYYYYYDIETSAANGTELLLGLDYKGLGFTAQTLLEDTVWGNAGDTYFKAAYSYALPQNFSLDAALGLYFYEESGKYIDDSKETFGFRHFDIGLSKPIGETGATASMTYTLGGYDRNEEKQKNKVAFGLTYSF